MASMPRLITNLFNIIIALDSRAERLGGCDRSALSFKTATARLSASDSCWTSLSRRKNAAERMDSDDGSTGTGCPGEMLRGGQDDDITDEDATDRCRADDAVDRGARPKHSDAMG